jgi:Haem-NO-binding
MHGLIFSAFRDYLNVRHSPETAAEVMAGEPIYLLSETYPDQRLTALIERAASLAGIDHDTVSHDFGVFTAESTFARLYPALFAMSLSARSFLLTVESQIHDVVRAAIPNARPPMLAVAECGLNGVSIVYSSPRRLCSFLRGLVERRRLYCPPRRGAATSAS